MNDSIGSNGRVSFASGVDFANRNQIRSVRRGMIFSGIEKMGADQNASLISRIKFMSGSPNCCGMNSVAGDADAVLGRQRAV